MHASTRAHTDVIHAVNIHTHAHYTRIKIKNKHMQHNAPSLSRSLEPEVLPGPKILPGPDVVNPGLFQESCLLSLANRNVHSLDSLHLDWPGFSGTMTLGTSNMMLTYLKRLRPVTALNSTWVQDLRWPLPAG